MVYNAETEQLLKDSIEELQARLLNQALEIRKLKYEKADLKLELDDKQATIEQLETQLEGWEATQ